RFDLVRTSAGILDLFVDDCELWLYGGAPPARAHRLQARVLYSDSLTGAVRVSRAAVEVLRALAAGNVGGISFSVPVRNLGFEDQQDKLDWVEGGGTLNIVSGATNGVGGPHGGGWYGRVQASTTVARHVHKELDLTAWVTGDQIDHDRVAVELAGYLASSSGLVLARLELSFWDSQPAIPGAVQVGGDHLSPTVNTTGWAQRTTGAVDVPAGARWLRIGFGCPVSTQTQYACADDLVLGVVTGSEPGAGGGAGSYRPLLQVCV
ncbi:MAG TPA: hypothetical protein VFY87_31565, partial [Geminicoccaceae bacterium]|nr:hypothetical protein [Geminicoccaceae bacterium]